MLWVTPMSKMGSNDMNTTLLEIDSMQKQSLTMPLKFTTIRIEKPSK
jgi:hypothetical protein